MHLSKFTTVPFAIIPSRIWPDEGVWCGDLDFGRHNFLVWLAAIWGRNCNPLNRSLASLWSLQMHVSMYLIIILYVFGVGLKVEMKQKNIYTANITLQHWFNVIALIRLQTFLINVFWTVLFSKGSEASVWEKTNKYAVIILSSHIFLRCIAVLGLHEKCQWITFMPKSFQCYFIYLFIHFWSRTPVSTAHKSEMSVFSKSVSGGGGDISVIICSGIGSVGSAFWLSVFPILKYNNKRNTHCKKSCK